MPWLRRSATSAHTWSSTHPAASLALRPVVVGSGGDDLVIVSALVNELSALAEPLVIVVDDDHLIDNAGVLQGIKRLIDLCLRQVTSWCPAPVRVLRPRHSD